MSSAPLHVEDREVADDPVDVVVARGRRAGLLGAASARRRRRCRPARRRRGGSASGTQYDVRLLTVLPGAPREPSSCRLGCAQSPIAEMFWLPCRSTWVAPIITCRLPYATTSKTLRNGIQPSTTSRLGEQRRDPGEEQRLAVGDHQVGVAGQLGEPDAEHRQQPHRAAEDLAVVLERVRDRGGADVGAGHVAHLASSANAATAAWYAASSPSRKRALNAAQSSSVPDAAAAYARWNFSSRS